MNGGKPRGFVRQLLFLLSGPLVWAGHFNLLYGAVGFGGAFGFTPAGVGIFAWGVTLAAVAALSALLSLTKAHPALHEMARTAAAISLWLSCCRPWSFASFRFELPVSFRRFGITITHP